MGLGFRGTARRSLVLLPDLGQVARAREFLAGIGREAGFSEDRIFDLCVASSEAIANAIEHAPVKEQVEVRAVLLPERLEVQVEGPGEFQTPDRLGERRSRGLGLPLMAKLSDHLALYSGPRGGTLVTLTFYREGFHPDDVASPLPPGVLELLDAGVRGVGEVELEDLIDTHAVQSFLTDFYELAHVPLAIIDTKGKVLVGAGWSDICTRFHRADPESACHCVESDSELSGGVPEGEFKLYKCKNNMWDIATPMYVGGRLVGSIFSGQFFFDDESPDYDVFRAQARRYGFDERAYLAALDDVPRLSRHTVERTMAFFSKLARLLSNESYGRIKLARALAERDHLLETLRAGKCFETSASAPD